MIGIVVHGPESVTAFVPFETRAAILEVRPALLCPCYACVDRRSRERLERGRWYDDKRPQIANWVAFPLLPLEDFNVFAFQVWTRRREKRDGLAWCNGPRTFGDPRTYEDPNWRWAWR